MGWIFVCFDLPVGTKKQRRDATRFRKSLLNKGYFMLQNSVYVKSCVSYEKTQKHINIVSAIAPKTGCISIFYLTDKQWECSLNIYNKEYIKSNYAIEPNTKAPKQMTFW